MIPNLLLALVLISADQTIEKRKLVISCDPTSLEARRLELDLKSDPWIHKYYNVEVVKQRGGEPCWDESGKMTFQPWPNAPGATRSPFTTSGVAMILLRKRLREDQERRCPEHQKYKGHWFRYNRLWTVAEEPLPRD